MLYIRNLTSIIAKIFTYIIVKLFKRDGFIFGQSHDYNPSTSVSESSGSSVSVIKAIITQHN